jgi:hypothetical protein
MFISGMAAVQGGGSGYELSLGDDALQTPNDAQDYFGTEESAAAPHADYSTEYGTSCALHFALPEKQPHSCISLHNAVGNALLSLQRLQQNINKILRSSQHRGRVAVLV